MAPKWVGWGWAIKGDRLLTFSAFRMGAYSRWALIRGWALIRINTVVVIITEPQTLEFFKNNASVNSSCDQEERGASGWAQLELIYA